MSLNQCSSRSAVPSGAVAVLLEETELASPAVETTAAFDSSWMATTVPEEEELVFEEEDEDEVVDDEFVEPRLVPFLSAVSMAFRVFLPARPSTLSPFSFWKSATASSVLLPNLPSALPER